jgi:murein DD-endopeptidase MepM/ murein hydrolase activator NlpD
VIKRTWRDTNEERANLVRDNPGFAPEWEAPAGRFNFGDAPFVSDAMPNRRFADPTALFNNLQPFTEPRHIGIDFRGLSRACIYSFIYGKVINVGWFNSDRGRILVIANERARGIYLLAHLHADTIAHIQRGDRVVPGDVVAFVGRSWSNRNDTPPNVTEHLHLEYYNVSYEASLDIDPRDNPYAVLTGTGDNEWVVLPTQQNEGQLITNNLRNPYDHSERHGV